MSLVIQLCVYFYLSNLEVLNNTVFTLKKSWVVLNADTITKWKQRRKTFLQSFNFTHDLNLPGMFFPLTTVTVSGLSRAVLGRRNSLRSVLALLWYTTDRIGKENCSLPAWLPFNSKIYFVIQSIVLFTLY